MRIPPKTRLFYGRVCSSNVVKVGLAPLIARHHAPSCAGQVRRTLLDVTPVKHCNASPPVCCSVFGIRDPWVFLIPSRCGKHRRPDLVVRAFFLVHRGIPASVFQGSPQIRTLLMVCSKPRHENCRHVTHATDRAMSRPIGCNLYPRHPGTHVRNFHGAEHANRLA